MKRRLAVTLAILFSLIFGSIGCGTMRAATPEQAAAPVASSGPGNQYYDYSEAMLQLKKGNLEMAVTYLENAIRIDPGSLYLKSELASLYLRLKDNRRALSVVEQILQKDPDRIETLIMYGNIQQSLKNVDEAKRAYETVLKKDPDRKPIYMLLGGLYMKEEQLAKARQVYAQLVERYPDSYVGHFFLGKIYAKEGDVKRAEMEFEKTLALEPDLEEPRFELLNLYKTPEEESKIVGIYMDILRRNPENVRAAIDLAYFYERTGNGAASRELLFDLGKRSQTDPDVIRNVVQFYVDKKNYEASVIILEGMLAGAPDSSELNYLAGISYDGVENPEKAIQHLLAVTPDSRFYHNAAVHISFLYQEKGEVDKAIAHLEDVIERVPDSPELYLYLGSFHEERKNYSEAEKVLDKGLAFDPQNIQLLFRLGVVYDKMGRKDDVIDTMKSVIALDPENSNALNYLGYTYADMGVNLDEAEDLIQEALKHKPNDGYIMDSLGWVYYQKGDYQKAFEVLEKAYNLVSDDPIILEHLGDACMKINAPDKALTYYRLALELKNEDTAELEKKIQDLVSQGISDG